MNAVSTLYRSVIAGAICTVLVLSFSVADAALLFRGALVEHLVIGVALTFFGYLLHIAVIGYFTRLHHTQGTSQEVCIVIISAMLFSLQGRTEPDALLATSLAMIALSGVALGLALMICGAAKMGRYIRLLPLPLVSGFLVGSGILMITFAMAILHTGPLTLSDLMVVDAGPVWLKVLLGVAMGAVLVFVGSRRASEYTLPLMIVCGVLGFHASAAVGPYDLQQLIAADWTMSREVISVDYQPMTTALLGQVDWRAVLHTSPQLLSLMAVGVLSNSIKISSLEILTRQRIDENRELRLAGVTNVIGAGMALAPGFHGLSNSTVIAKLHGNTRVAAAFTVLASLVIVALASDMLVQMPRFVFGAILIWAGWSMVYDSFLVNLRKLRLHESVITILIALTVVVFGYLPGLVFGLACGLLMFAIEFGRLETVRAFRSVAELRSNVDRSPREHDLLTRHGARVGVVRLHSYLFFGSAARSVDLITAHLDAADKNVNTLIIDLSRVTGVDSTALRAFHRLGLRTESGGIEVWSCGASELLTQAFNKDGGKLFSAAFDSLDLALEAAEDRLLLSASADDVGEADNAQQASVLESVFEQYGRQVALEPGQDLLKSGDPSDGLYWLSSGVLDAFVDTDDAEIRVRRMSRGALVGEISWYLGVRTSARVVAVNETTMLHLDQAALEAIQADEPEVGARLHAEVARVLAFRLIDNTRQIRQLR